MLKGFKNGWKLIKGSTSVFFKHPKFLVPLLITWLLYAPIILYLKYFMNWEVFSTSQIFLIVFGIIFFFALLLTISCSIVLELIQQLESNKKLSLSKAVIDTFSKNLLKALPIIFIWSVLWFILLLIQAILSKKKDNDSDEEFTAENAAKTLSGYENMTFSKALFKMLEKGMRMVVFLILPAIAWDNLNFKKAVKKGINVFKSNLSTFAAGLVLTEAAASIVFLPPAILLKVASETEAPFPEWVWATTFIYIAFAWSYSMYLEQMFSAELYLWNHKWEKEVAIAKKKGREIPNLNDIEKPSLLDTSYDLS